MAVFPSGKLFCRTRPPPSKSILYSPDKKLSIFYRKTFPKINGVVICFARCPLPGGPPPPPPPPAPTTPPPTHTASTHPIATRLVGVSAQTDSLDLHVKVHPHVILLQIAQTASHARAGYAAPQKDPSIAQVHMIQRARYLCVNKFSKYHPLLEMVEPVQTKTHFVRALLVFVGSRVAMVLWDHARSTIFAGNVEVAAIPAQRQISPAMACLDQVCHSIDAESAVATIRRATCRSRETAL
jgi:hypothetical protein